MKYPVIGIFFLLNLSYHYGLKYQYMNLITRLTKLLCIYVPYIFTVVVICFLVDGRKQKEGIFVDNPNLYEIYSIDNYTDYKGNNVIFSKKDTSYLYTTFNNTVFSNYKYKINSHIFLFSSMFNENLYFHKSIFNNSVEMMDVEIKKKFDISGSSFNRDFSSNDCMYLGSVIFREVEIDGKIDFKRTLFCDTLRFINLKLRDSSFFYFNLCKFPDYIDFSFNNNIKNEIDLTVADFNIPKRFDTVNKLYKKHKTNLYKSDISKFHIDYQHFYLDTLYLDALDKTKTIPKDEMMGIYESLLNNFKTRGQQDSYELLDY
ncbi:hypothetical protein ACLI09_05830 [Flavobacterium sp. RHBU_24]|uniref:hypothetical protein n=1 Tax=Flavobacterium sp. RHBU_24 TaxID=3391185 RepID=UPI00398544DB